MDSVFSLLLIFIFGQQHMLQCHSKVKSMNPGDFELTRSPDDAPALSFLFATPVLQRHYGDDIAGLNAIADVVKEKFDSFITDDVSNTYKIYKGSEQVPGSRTDAFYWWYVEGAEQGNDNKFLFWEENFHMVQPVLKFLESAVIDWFAWTGQSGLARLLRKGEKQVSFWPIWPTVQHHGTVHKPHNHTNSALSGVMFLRDAPGSPELHLFDPRPRNIDWHSQEGSRSAAAIVPARVGDLVLFPPWLTHSVEHSSLRSERESTANDARVTLAFNIRILNQNSEADEPTCLDCNVMVQPRVGSRGVAKDVRERDEL
eukprot:TRINITY_DN105727_c0_g1_i1.p1 TRINITY_DN105727_c0_g1~~TRINITY_DN105727_c0_g1_i1.p1  ORF type:complete len:314 (+),score=48.81 TRINITY_DN105727_c0_g1_i1:56-997(+)